MTWLNWPNRITIARILLVAPLAICLLNLNAGWPGMRYLALGLFGIMALSDALDGFLARRLKQETAVGQFLDPLGDKLLVVCAVVILSSPSTAVVGAQLPNWVVVIALGKEVVTVSGFALIYLTTGAVFIQPRIWGKACTVLQLLMIGAILLTPDVPELMHALSRGLWYTATAVAIVATIDYMRVGSRFAARRNSDRERSVDTHKHQE